MAMRTWAEMRETIGDRLLRQTGHDVAWWNDRVAAQGGLDDEAAPRIWLASEGITGYQQMLLVMERFSYPAFFLAAVSTFGPVHIRARKTYTSQLTPRRTFRSSAGGGLNVRLPLESVDDLDAEALALLRQAYDTGL